MTEWASLGALWRGARREPYQKSPDEPWGQSSKGQRTDEMMSLGGEGAEAAASANKKTYLEWCREREHRMRCRGRGGYRRRGKGSWENPR